MALARARAPKRGQGSRTAQRGGAPPGRSSALISVQQLLSRVCEREEGDDELARDADCLSSCGVRLAAQRRTLLSFFRHCNVDFARKRIVAAAPAGDSPAARAALALELVRRHMGGGGGGGGE